MTYPTTRTHPRTLADAFADERAYCIEGPMGHRMGLSVKMRPSLLQRIWRYLWGRS